jgi:hypothetical protein
MRPLIDYIGPALIAYLIMGVIWSTWSVIGVLRDAEFFDVSKRLTSTLPPEQRPNTTAFLVVGLILCWLWWAIVWPWRVWRAATRGDE